MTEQNPDWVKATPEELIAMELTTKAGTQVNMSFRIKGDDHEDFNRVKDMIRELLHNLK